MAFKEICPAGPGYHYSASSLQFNQKVTEQLGSRGSLPVTQDNQGTYCRVKPPLIYLPDYQTQNIHPFICPSFHPPTPPLSSHIWVQWQRSLQVSAETFLRSGGWWSECLSDFRCRLQRWIVGYPNQTQSPSVSPGLRLSCLQACAAWQRCHHKHPGQTPDSRQTRVPAEPAWVCSTFDNAAKTSASVHQQSG